MASKPFRDRVFAIPWFDFFRLRPYGDSLATPAVMVWLGFAWVVILLMASIEGIVWGLVGASIVPEGVAWLRPVAGLFLFVLIFAIIWIVDASLILSERPPLRARSWHPGANQGVGALLRWWFSGAVSRTREDNFHPGQREAILLVVLAHEVFGDCDPQRLSQRAGMTDPAVTAAPPARDMRLSLRSAPAIGQRWVLQALQVWQWANHMAARAAGREDASATGSPCWCRRRSASTGRTACSGRSS